MLLVAGSGRVFGLIKHPELCCFGLPVTRQYHQVSELNFPYIRLGRLSIKANTHAGKFPVFLSCYSLIWFQRTLFRALKASDDEHFCKCICQTGPHMIPDIPHKVPTPVTILKY